MSTTYFGILTKIGEAKQANALALGGTLKLTHLAVGDGGGNTPTPNHEQTQLVGEWRRAPLNQLYVHADNPNYLVAEQVIPEAEGGKWIREWGLYDEDGDLVAVANCPPTYKPLLAEGSGRTQVVRMVIMVASTAAFTLKIDPAVVLATREYVDAGLATKQPKGNYAPVFSIFSLPQNNIGPIVVAECSEVWIWTSSQYFTGYRSPLCGRPVDGHTSAPLASEIDAIGGLLDKTAYAGLWGYAQENGLAVTQSVWDTNRGGHYFVNVNATQFRAPDLRNMFRRFSGTDADTANARAFGSRQSGSVHSFDIGPGVGLVSDRSGVIPNTAANARIDLGYDAVAASEYPAALVVSISSGTPSAIINTSEVAFGATRVQNVAYQPRLHV